MLNCVGTYALFTYMGNKIIIVYLNAFTCYTVIDTYFYYYRGDKDRLYIIQFKIHFYLVCTYTI